LDQLIETRFAACMKPRHHRQGASAAGKGRELPRAEEAHVLVEGTGQMPRARA
jgi:hypothetical protein